ncbi:MFS transporter [Polaromonas naphthalenivorans]|uniref:Major facilitator superfamily MFS_1 n=1 Tax=Polaromonas naphthalenivorans (strain CJ2) TaxID=365044 RepID=A1VRM1_POLNA|nr:MFS transporter [Polaromonas naphthalenivorans]ABM38299.1 major facilitator superfamily MFS_1 [Polaromonas naphthalenivorans CJ2]
MTQPASPAPRLPAAIWALGFVSLLMDISSEMIHSLLPVFMVTVLGTSVWAVGLIEGAAEATALIVKVFSGVLSDYWGKRKPLAVLGYGLGAASKPLFALASTTGMVLAARLIDRVGKGIRGAPRDALVADLAPPGMRGAAFGLRQSLDTVGAFIGPLLAMGLMLLWANDFRAIFWVAMVPGFMAVALLLLGVQEPAPAGPVPAARPNPISRDNLRRLGSAYWRVVFIGALFTLARFSEAFLVLRALQGGMPVAWTPLVLIGMNVVYALGAYPFGKLSDSVSHTALLAWGLVVLIAADAVLATSSHWTWVAAGIALWGLHMAMTQGLLATMVAQVAPPDLRGTAFGFFNLMSGLAMLLASTVAGVLWDQLGAPATFVTGAVFSLAALALLWHWRGMHR